MKKILKSVTIVIICCLIVHGAGMILTVYADLSKIPTYPFLFEVYPENAIQDNCLFSFSDKSAMRVQQWNIDAIEFSGTMPTNLNYEIPHPYTTMIYEFKRQCSTQARNPFDFYAAGKLYFRVVVLDDASVQCVDQSQDFGFVITPARVLDGIYIDENGETQQDYFDENSYFEKNMEIFLAETYFVKNVKGENVLYTSRGNLQKPLKKGREYIVCINGMAANYTSDNKTAQDLKTVNTAPLYVNNRILFFDEQLFWDTNDLKKDDDYLKKLSGNGLYADYANIQYPYVKSVVDSYNQLLAGENLDSVSVFEQNESERIIWFIPAILGFFTGVLVCLIPAAVILTVKKRKKKASNASDKPADPDATTE